MQLHTTQENNSVHLVKFISNEIKNESSSAEDYRVFIQIKFCSHLTVSGRIH